jgi:hypothetical protein
MMKKNLLLFSIIILVFLWANVSGQTTTTVEIPIIQNGEMATDTLDDGTIVTFGLSSDDAEQENDEMDTLHDDDLDAGWEGDPEDLNVLTAGLRFQNVSVPKGATIESAYIVVTSHEAKAAEDIALINIVGHKHANSPTFSMDELITSRPETTASVLWEVAEEWGLWTDHQSVDISPVIQEIIDMNDWSYGNSLSLILKGSDEQGTSDFENAREFESFENIADPEDGGDGTNHPERVPRLVIEYSFESTVFDTPIVGNGEFATDTLDNGTIVTFELSSDDAEQENDEMDTLHDDDLDAGWEGDPEDLNILTAGLRFQNVSIPKGVHIDSAYVVVCSHEAKAAEDVALITIVAEATDNAQTFSMDQLITDRPQTQASVLWEIAEEWGLWTYHKTADISPVIQEIVDRDGWASGNAIALILLGSDEQGTSDYENAREFESFENIADPEDGGDGTNHPERVPKLVVYYSSGSSIGQTLTTHKSLDIFPNPTSYGSFSISLESDEKADIIIYNEVGNEVYSQTVDHETTVEVNTADLPKGIYLVRVLQADHQYSQKLIIN